MRLLAVALCCFLTIGCFSSSTRNAKHAEARARKHEMVLARREAEWAAHDRRDARARADPRLQRVVHHYSSLLVMPTCDGKPSAPAAQESVIAGVRVVQPCGLVSVELEDNEAYQSFAASQCVGIADQACNEAYTRMFVARMRERYVHADQGRIANHCTGYPDECSSFSGLEAYYLRTHNEAVGHALETEAAALSTQIDAERRARFLAYEAEDARLAQEEEMRRQQAAERRRATWRAVGEALQSQQAQQPVNCTSRVNGDTVHTTCQ